VAADVAQVSDLHVKRVWAKIGLGVIIKGQAHYPCRCHDWVLGDDGWRLVARPTK
jgi:hypothetical protein